MENEILLLLGGVFLLLICSAFFSGSETALMSSSKPKLHNQEKAGHKGAKRVNKIVADPERLLGTILLGNNLVNIAASALTTGLFIKLFGDRGIAFATIIMTFMVLIFAEILPKTIASRSPEKHAFWISVPMSFLIVILSPFTKFISKISRFLMRCIGINPNEIPEKFAQEDVQGAIGMGLEEGVLAKGEHRMLDSIMKLDKVNVAELMVHRKSIESLDSELTMEEIYEKLSNKPVHSRIPLWQGESDNIIGILLIKDFFKAHYKATQKGANFNLKDIMQKPYFIPETVTASRQMLEFRKKRSHMALVVDEYGDIQGLVTLEDILEEIVGEIEDEHDIIKSDFTHHRDGAITISGDFTVRDANREFDWNIPDEEAVTVAGYIIDSIERIPNIGEKLEINGMIFQILSKKRQAIKRVKVLAPTSETPPENKQENKKEKI